jgi:hypothetical protein
MAALITLTPASQSADSPTKKDGDKAVRKGTPGPSVKGTLAAEVKLTAPDLARHIDKLISKRLQADKIDISPRCDDAEFVRRVHLDIIGTVPTMERTVAFLDSKEPDKRAKLVDELLASKDYGKHMSDVWQAMMLPRDSETFRIKQYFPNVVKWLEESFNDNKSWDKMVREVLTASGPVDKTSPTAYYLANGTVDKMTDNFTKLFLGVQLQCAQCHNHPFTEWKQTEYWGMAAFFMKVRPDGNPRAAAKDGKTIIISENAKAKGKRQQLPESAKIVPHKFLQGEQPKLSASEPARPSLADWAASPKNPFLAKAMVNRTWAQFFGRGFVNPVDDMHDGNAASHPELLMDLAGQFTNSGFDVKHLIRAICTSETYQRTSKPTGNNGGAPTEMFARMAVKVMTPEQLYDSLNRVLDLSTRGGGAAGRRPAAGGFQRGPGTPREAFVAFYNLDDGYDPTEFQAGIPQVLRLMNAPQFNSTPTVANITKNAKDWKDATEKFYLTTLARRPTPEEVARVEKYLARHKGEARAGLGDVLWALVNSSEFAVNH